MPKNNDTVLANTLKIQMCLALRQIRGYSTVYRGEKVQ